MAGELSRAWPVAQMIERRKAQETECFLLACAVRMGIAEA